MSANQQGTCVGGAEGLVSDDEVRAALRVVAHSPMCRRTPLLVGMEHLLTAATGDGSAARQRQLLAGRGVKLLLKMENMQVTGSFKARGVANQFDTLPSGAECIELVTMSAGNYGKAFAHAISQINNPEDPGPQQPPRVKGLVLLPLTAPTNRIHTIRSYGVDTESLDVSLLQSTCQRYVSERGMVYQHSFDDRRLLAGYASVGVEIMEQCREGGTQGPASSPPDIVLVPCGGGGLVAGVATAIKQYCHSPQTRVYAVEPQGACGMYQSFRAGCPVKPDRIETVASGLAAPYAGGVPYTHCKRYVDDVLLVTDDEIKAAVKVLYESGIVAEPAGCAGLAALLHHHVPDIPATSTVVCVITGGNVTPQELTQLWPTDHH